MPIVTAAGVVSYLGDLFQQAERPNALLRLLGGMPNPRTGQMGTIVETTSREFPVGVYYSLSAPSQPAILEGAAAPPATNRSLTQSTNVVQIFHRTVGQTFMAMGEKAVGGIVPIPQGGAQGQVQDARSLDFQIQTEVEQIACDLNYTLLRGIYENPANPAETALKSRGLLTCITTNTVDKSAEATPDAETFKSWIEDLVRTIVNECGFVIDNTWYLFADTTQFNNAQAAYEGYTTLPTSATVAGLQVLVLRTRMGNLNLVLEPDMPANTLMAAQVGKCALVGMRSGPENEFIYERPLGETGASQSIQIYGQFGLDHAMEWFHGKLLVPAGTLA